MERGEGSSMQPKSYEKSSSQAMDKSKRQELEHMPVANVTRIMRRALPPHAKIAKEAKETMQQCISDFIGFVTSEANEQCHKESRKTVTSDDILLAMGNLGFEDYVAPLRTYVDNMRKQESSSPNFVAPNVYGSTSTAVDHGESYANSECSCTNDAGTLARDD